MTDSVLELTAVTVQLSLLIIVCITMSLAPNH